MNNIFTTIFKNYPANKITPMFSWLHIVLIIIGIGTPLIIAFLLRNKSEKTKNIILKISALYIIISYLFDFIIQPIWNGSMTPSKLPFHICTATGILLVFVTFSKKFDKLKVVITVWALMAPMFYILFPFNTINSNVALYSYSRVQPYLYHVVEIFWGAYMLFSGKVKLNWKTVWQPIVGLFPMALWATFGQELYYPNEVGENFLMLRTDVTGIVPHGVYILALFTAAVLTISCVYGIYNLVVYVKYKKYAKHETVEEIDEELVNQV